jgi:hypothetical protein
MTQVDTFAAGSGSPRQQRRGTIHRLQLEADFGRLFFNPFLREGGIEIRFKGVSK